MTNWILWLFIYSFIGWVYESTLCSISERRLINRGFLHSPLCPVYGFGALALIAILDGRIENPYELFFLGMIITLSVEYFTGWLLETLFHKKWWDYSKYRFNIKGRVCLHGAIGFGLAAVVLISYIHPFVSAYTSLVSSYTKSILALVLGIIVLADTAFTTNKLLNEELPKLKLREKYVKVLKQPIDYTKKLKARLM